MHAPGSHTVSPQKTGDFRGFSRSIDVMRREHEHGSFRGTLGFAYSSPSGWSSRVRSNPSRSGSA